MEELKAAHRKQLRDLTALVTQKKKAATKKTRRGVNEECDRLERELKERQRLELEELEGGGLAEEDDDAVEQHEATEEDKVTNSISELSLGNGTTTQQPQTTSTSTTNDTTSVSEENTGKGKKPNRAKARLARRAAAMEESIAQAQAEADAMPDEKEVERQRMHSLFEEQGLKETQIAPDGHCLYAAFAHGLRIAGVDLNLPANNNDEGDIAANENKQRDYTKTRKAAGSYISSHGEDFEPFIAAEGTSMEDYVHKVTSTAEWGGEMELMALAKTYGVTVKVVQAQGKPVTLINEDEADANDSDEQRKEIWLAYYRRGYGLGEHYNALQKG